MSRRKLQHGVAAALSRQPSLHPPHGLTRSTPAYTSCCFSCPCQSRTRYSTAALSRPPSTDSKLRHSSRVASRRYAATCTAGEPQRFAVIGGGATGLTAAYYLAKNKPNAKITIYEASERLGGWIRTERMPVTVDGAQKEIMIEFGPRGTPWPLSNCWRFDDLVLWDLLEDFGMLKTVTGRPTIGRGVFHNGELVDLTKLTPYQALLQPNGLYKGLFPSLLGLKLSQLQKRHEELPPDMSVTEWLRHIGCAQPVIDNLVSAFLHGVHGGDPDKLSARLVLDWIYWSYYQPQESTKIQVPPSELDILERLGNKAKPHHLESIKHLPSGGMSLLHFGPGGMSTLTEALEFALKNPNVKFELGQPVKRLSRQQGNGKIHVQTLRQDTSTNETRETTEAYDSVICAISPDKVAQMSEVELPTLNEVRSTSMWTVGIFCPHQKFPSTENAIGYTIPRSCDPSQNPHRALGIFFDHNAGNLPRDEPRGTKLFVLMGGHYYDSGEAPTPATTGEAVRQAVETASAQLGIDLSHVDVHAAGHFAQNCIPQLEVGHTSRLNAAHEAIQRHYGEGGVVLAGGAYHRPGVLGALRSGWDAAAEVLGWNSYNHGAAVTESERPVVIDPSMVPRPSRIISAAPQSAYLRHLRWGLG